MQTTAGPGGRSPDSSARPMSRLMAIALAVLALGCGIAGLFSLSTEMWGLGLIGFGCLLAILALLAQASEHFARASGPRPVTGVTVR
jgi:predicted acyltransferase